MIPASQAAHFFVGGRPIALTAPLEQYGTLKDYAERFSIFSAVIPVGDLAWACLRWNDKQTEQKT